MPHCCKQQGNGKHHHTHVCDGKAGHFVFPPKTNSETHHKAGLLAHLNFSAPSRGAIGATVAKLLKNLLCGTIPHQAYSYGDSTGFTPVSLLIPVHLQNRKPNDAQR